MHLPTTLTLSLILLLQTGCGLLGSDPKEPELEPGRRDYVWEVDTLYNGPSGWMNTIWGSSPDDIWMGSLGGVNQLWHFDGNEWRSGSQKIFRSIYSIYGFSKNDVWMGTNGDIYHFDGEEWVSFYKYKPEGMGVPRIYDVWGRTSTDIYAVGGATNDSDEGYKGFLLHFNGQTWKEVLITDFNIHFLKVRSTAQKVFIEALKFPDESQQEEEMFVFEYEANKLEIVISKKVSETENFSMNLIGDEIFILYENLFSKYINNELNDIIYLPNRLKPFGIYGRNTKDIFLVEQKRIEHFNNEDTHTLVTLKNANTNMYRGFVTKEDVFFIAHNYSANTNLIYTGILKSKSQDNQNKSKQKK